MDLFQGVISGVLHCEAHNRIWQLLSILPLGTLGVIGRAVCFTSTEMHIVSIIRLSFPSPPPFTAPPAARECKAELGSFMSLWTGDHLEVRRVATHRTALVCC